jgi:hypothetical protein
MEKGTVIKIFVIGLITIGIVVGILTIVGVFNPKPETNNGNGTNYPDIDLAWYDTSVKCRNKYPNNPSAFGNNKYKYNKGCYECPDGYKLHYMDELRYKDTPTCYKFDYKPALPDETDKTKFSCGKYITDNDMPTLYRSKITPTNVSPWDTIQPNMCAIRKDINNGIPASFVGAL